MTNIPIIMFSIVGIMLWLAGIVIAIYLMLDRSEDFVNRLSCTMACCVVFGLLGMGFNVPGIIEPVWDVKYRYEVPTHITKTNDITVITYISDKGKLAYKSDTSAEWYNATNIMVKMPYGENFYRKSVVGLPEIILYTE